jgi:hypothetical protein
MIATQSKQASNANLASYQSTAGKLANAILESKIRKDIKQASNSNLSK